MQPVRPTRSLTETIFYCMSGGFGESLSDLNTVYYRADFRSGRIAGEL